MNEVKNLKRFGAKGWILIGVLNTVLILFALSRYVNFHI